MLVYKLQHTIAHALIRNLGERSGFSEETMAEYLIPELLTIGLYADTHQEFTLGALVSLVEHRLAEWLDATLDGADTCAWDPQCGQQDGACAACLHLAFGCATFNAELDRAVLFGSAARPRARARRRARLLDVPVSGPSPSPSAARLSVSVRCAYGALDLFGGRTERCCPGRRAWPATDAAETLPPDWWAEALPER